MIGSFLKRKMWFSNFRITHLIFGIIILATIIFYSTLNGRQYDIVIKKSTEFRHNGTEIHFVPLPLTNTSLIDVKTKLIKRKNCGFFSFFANGCGLTSNITSVLLGEGKLIANDSSLKTEVNSGNIQKIEKLVENQEVAVKMEILPPDNHSLPNKTVVANNKVDSSAERVIKTKDIYEKGHMNDQTSISNICPQKGADVNLLILVTSAPTHREQRLSIRQSWGHYGIRRDISIGFMLGRTQDQRIEDQLSAENYMYSDLIRGNFIDSYKNLTLKTISLLEWTATNCPNVTYLLKTDDDMFINVPKLLQFIETHLSYKRSIFGRLAKKWKPIRNKKSKYYVSPEQYFPPVFPPFTTASDGN